MTLQSEKQTISMYVHIRAQNALPSNKCHTIHTQIRMIAAF